MSGRISLIVDDEPYVRQYIRTILQRESFTTLEASSGAEAFRMLQELDGIVDLVVSDIQMPGCMDGMALAQSVRETFPATAVIIVSGYADPETTGGSDFGFPFLQKPFLPEALLNAVRQVIH